MLELGTKIFYLHENKVVEAYILSTCEIRNGNSEDNRPPETATRAANWNTLYRRFGETKCMYATKHGVVEEDRAFASKAELLDSLT